MVNSARLRGYIKVSDINFFIVGLPIGNYRDITLRAIDILKEVDFIVCENEKEYKKVFTYLNIDIKKFVLCNEDSEKESIELVIDLLKKGEKGALISDCGVPVFEDPGFLLIDSIRKNGYRVTSVPGANSIITAISLSPFKIRKFYFASFLSQKKELREKELRDLIKRKECIILMESPYRLNNIIELFKKIIPKRNIYIPFNLTMDDEKFFYGKPEYVEKEIIKNNIKKGEFLIVIENSNS